MSLGYSHFSQPPLYAESCVLGWAIVSYDPNWHMNFEIVAPVFRVLSSLNEGFRVTIHFEQTFFIHSIFNASPGHATTSRATTTR